jgi:hypothetical protein
MGALVLPGLLATILATAAVFAWLIFKPAPVRKRSSLELRADAEAELRNAGPMNRPRLGGAAAARRADRRRP